MAKGQISSTRTPTRHCGLIATGNLCMQIVNWKQQCICCNQALRHLEEGEERETISLLALMRISGHCNAGKMKDALQILAQRCIMADANTYVCFLKECIKMKRLVEGTKVHAHIIQSGSSPNIFLYNTLINMYAKCGSVVDARLVFDKMPEQDVFTRNIMMAGYATHGHSREALEIYVEMIQAGVAPNNAPSV